MATRAAGQIAICRKCNFCSNQNIFRFSFSLVALEDDSIFMINLNQEISAFSHDLFQELLWFS
jgi:hypothetical protein